MFCSELYKDMEVAISIFNNIERRYKILDIYDDGIKVLYQHSTIKDGEDILIDDIMLIPYSRINYIRLV